MAKKRTPFQPKGTSTKYVPNTPPRPRPKLGPILLGGGLLYLTATYVSMVVFKSKNDTTDPKPKVQAVTPSRFDTSPVWERVAKNYDKEIGWDELVMGIGIMRRWLVGQAKGDVLEVSTGTGRNFAYYKPDQVDSVTFTDCHSSMLNEAKSKFEGYKDQFHKTFVNFSQVDVDQSTAIKEKYDTVIDTFGLCSCSDPANALITMAESCKSEESRILLLEHGRSYYDWLNRLLDSNVDKHVTRWGCWWNRDLIGLFEQEKVREKLEIVKVSRWHFGTTCYIIAKPKKQQTENT
ncbi:Methyltransferase-like protein 7B [Apophysomyces ossiformis]|uniref:Methyltransferase-like protein 7B n=1 Tax=Apophysomyces ossiformis TaxID=679940 RepID=A0A8H7BMY5_9FUNG|nr:Methyltransferase-like protein 7B [Apophysomyces ossiformis]